MKTLTITIAIVVFSMTNMFSQNCSDWAMGLDFLLFQPKEEIQTQGFGMNYGANFDFFYVGKQNKFRVLPGIRLNGGISKGILRTFDVFETGDEVGEIRTRNTHFDAKAVLRADLNVISNFRTYIEGFGGFRFSGTREEAEISSFGDQVGEVDDMRYTGRRTSGVYGMALGLLYDITDQVALNLKGGVEYSDVQYVDVNSNNFNSFYRTDDAKNYFFTIGVFIKLDHCENDNVSNKRPIKTRKPRARTKKVPNTGAPTVVKT